MNFSVTEPQDVLVDQDGLEFSLKEPEVVLDAVSGVD